MSQFTVCCVLILLHGSVHYHEGFHYTLSSHGPTPLPPTPAPQRHPPPPLMAHWLISWLATVSNTGG